MKWNALFIFAIAMTVHAANTEAPNKSPVITCIKSQSN